MLIRTKMKTGKPVIANDLSQNSQLGELPGLFIGHSMIEGLGGRIEVESEPGKGSTFRIILTDMNNRA